MYYSFMTKEDKKIYREVCDEVLKRRQVKPTVKKAILKLQSEIRATYTSGTDQGKARKMRIVDKVLICQDKTQLLLCFYTCVLPMLQHYTLTFQAKEPMIQQLHAKQEELLSGFFANFMTPEALDVDVSKLKKIDLSNRKSQLPDSAIFIGKTARELINSRPRDDSVSREFLDQARKAYEACGSTLQEKMPLMNKVLRCVSTLDPRVRGNTTTLKLMLDLKSHFSHLISEEESDAFDHEARKFQLDKNLPQLEFVTVEKEAGNWKER